MAMYRDRILLLPGLAVSFRGRKDCIRSFSKITRKAKENEYEEEKK